MAAEKMTSLIFESTPNWKEVISLASTTLKLAANTLNVVPGFGPSSAASISVESIPTYTLEQVSWHDSPSDCWIVIYDKVYDLTSFLTEHPGGEEVILENAGRDATIAFRGVRHSKDSLIMMEKYCIGILIEKERLYLNKKKSIFG